MIGDVLAVGGEQRCGRPLFIREDVSCLGIDHSHTALDEYVLYLNGRWFDRSGLSLSRYFHSDSLAGEVLVG